MSDWNDFVFKSHLTGGTEHAVGNNASEFTLCNLDAAFLLWLSVERSRNVAAGKRHRYISAFKDVRRSCNDLKKSVLILALSICVADVDSAYYQLISIRMRLDLLDFTYYDVLGVFAEPVACLKIRSGHDHTVAELFCADVAQINIVIYPFNRY